MPQIKTIPEKIFDPNTKHQFILCHQDDELAYGGIVQRIRHNANFLWVTNGDGLAGKFKEDPQKYAEKRWKETSDAMNAAGISSEKMECLNKSELDIYDDFAKLIKEPENRNKILEKFFQIGCGVYKVIKEFNPDVVWTCAYQGGHPEHDLTHLFAAFGAKQVLEEEKIDITICEIPQYEFTILVPLRFKPWKKGIIHEVFLTENELEVKKKMMEKYPSQFFLFEQFKKVINTIGFFGRIFGKKITFETYAGRETFAVVEKDRDYTKSTHIWDGFDYMFDRNNGVKISFKKTISIIADYLGKNKFRI